VQPTKPIIAKTFTFNLPDNGVCDQLRLWVVV
jgi:hypothetical protein